MIERYTKPDTNIIEEKKYFIRMATEPEAAVDSMYGFSIELQIQWSCRTRDNSIYRRLTISTRSVLRV